MTHQPLKHLNNMSRHICFDFKALVLYKLSTYCYVLTYVHGGLLFWIYSVFGWSLGNCLGWVEPMRHCCMSHSDELPSANALSALQHHLSGTLSLSLFRTVTCSRYLNLDLKHICSPPSMLLNSPVRQRLRSHGNMALYKFCIVLYYCILYSSAV